MNPASGGPCQGIRNSVSALEELGVLNEVVCCDSPDEIWIKKYPFPVHALGPGKFGYSYTTKLQAWLEEKIPRFDGVIVHGIWQWPVQATTRAFKKLKANSPPVTRHPPLFIMPHGMLDPWFQRDKSRRLKAIRNSIYWWLFERHAVNSADALLFTCEEELRLARTTFGGYRPKREINIGYGIAEPPVFESQMREAFQAQYPELGNNPYLLFLGRIHPKKGVDLLIRAYAEVLKTEKLKTIPPHLVIAGPGWETSYGRQMRQLMDAANCEILPENAPHIHSVGMLEGDSKLGALFGCEAFVLPSHQENFGISVVEALACGKLVLISNKVNIWREIVEAGAGIVGDDTFEGIKNLLASWGRIRLTGEMPESLPNNGRDISADTTFDLEFSFRIRESSLKCFDKNFLITRLANNIKKLIDI
jgi:glycosyltransferase involved in cell wall biosynthesis